HPATVDFTHRTGENSMDRIFTYCLLNLRGTHKKQTTVYLSLLSALILLIDKFTIIKLNILKKKIPFY
ncbi:hypothetical protein, partial [Orenia marismortui]|uniref:hypothetical protein n=1 Tax=Orenia marismortui TaxID=46469 RepID=UPI000476B411